MSVLATNAASARSRRPDESVTFSTVTDEVEVYVVVDVLTVELVTVVSVDYVVLVSVDEKVVVVVVVVQ